MGRRYKNPPTKVLLKTGKCTDKMAAIAKLSMSLAGSSLDQGSERQHWWRGSNEVGGEQEEQEEEILVIKKAQQTAQALVRFTGMLLSVRMDA